MIWSEVEVMVEKGPEIEENEIICFNGLTHFFSVYDQQSTMMIARQPGWAMPHCINEDNNVDGDEKGWHGYWKCQELQFKYNNEDTDGHEDNTKGGALCEEVLPSVHYENDNNEERDGKTTKR